MSAYRIVYQDGHKRMVPIRSEEEYRRLRNTPQQQESVRRARRGETYQDSRGVEHPVKMRLLQVNYSCLPTCPADVDPEQWDGSGLLRGCTTASGTIGMDIDFDRDDPDYNQKMASVPELVLMKREELGLLMLERSATKGYHLVFRRRFTEGLADGHVLENQEQNLRWASDLLGVRFDEGAKDITRVFFTTTASDEDLIYLDKGLFEQEKVGIRLSPDPSLSGRGADTTGNYNAAEESKGNNAANNSSRLLYLGIPYSTIIKTWWKLYNDGREPVTSNRDALTFELAVNLRHICGFDRDLMDRVIPAYDGFPEAQKMKCIDSALSEKRTQMPVRLKNVLAILRRENAGNRDILQAFDEVQEQDDLFYYNALPRMPLGIRDSIEAVGHQMAMPIITAICPAIGALATGVVLDVHGTKHNLNLIAYIAGEFATGKGSIDPVWYAWMSEVLAQDKIYQAQHDEWKRKMKAKRNAKDLPEEPILPIRILTLNNTSANLTEQLARTGGKHAASFTPEADIIAQQFRGLLFELSVMLRCSYDGSYYAREAKSIDSACAHIDRLLWNVTLCGTPDALYRVVNNYTDGFQSRIAIARTPDNTFAPLPKKIFSLTDVEEEHIHQVAHLLPLMEGEVTLGKLEERSRNWLEDVRKETMENGDRVRAKQRIRVCVTAQRMTCCVMLCLVCERLIARHGLAGAEASLKSDPDLWRRMLLRCQTDAMLQTFDVIADSLFENTLYYFESRLRKASESKEYGGSGQRLRRGKNDSIFARLDVNFTFEQARQQTYAVKGESATDNCIVQMLKNWEYQGLIARTENRGYRKVVS